MTLIQWLIFFLVIQLIHGLGTWKLYIKAGRQAWEAFIPVYNAVILMKIINRPWWWTILLFLPIVNLIMFAVVWVETARSFRKNSNIDTILAVATLGLYNFYLNYVADVSHVKDRSLHPKTGLGDWVSSILFAIVAATIVHTYFIQPFTIPTSSLEKTLLVGDFLFVSKFHYGARVPMTTIAAPMVHDTIPGLKIKSYSSDYELPYLRIPGFQNIKHNDIVVFNWPVDTMLDMRHTDKFYYKPIDKKTNYVKRCVGLPGDSLEVRNGFVYINGKQNVLPERAKLQFSYMIETKTGAFNNYQLANRYHITDFPQYNQDRSVSYFPAITDEDLKVFKNHPNINSITPLKEEQGKRDVNIFPSHPDFNWNNDFFGPIYIPEAGKTINLNLNILPLYKRLLTAYEGNTLDVQGNQILINGKVANTYTFKKDYYWMMGDNRHNSQDARAWGFVPFDHVVGKPVFIWMSWNTNGQGFDKIRWDRLFTTVGGNGQPVSYLIPFLVVLALWTGFNKWRKHKKEHS
ncbi:MAG: signal peptidase I [Flavobacteriales bacterium]|nr:signal peptidase I [Flavobacteriia bacterium]NCP05976.1 signal peptidase I [Flavobacteriales bacterium]PIV93992.1 MAG: signal peptidase I [Flavobacteriaceae bacterium CG17_big_fil_post_rev_8_21_14_2_50_33_15]PIY10140.1 MAG: signal peptidase I [Flavobacteriaceae bacterium CG_4_10_14_3_um_filter_33_47]PJB16301.1 MAG: signal peptidase I [Flavobacteriaceae bacterium CG_4_9_14_3_um_filter_33_16]